MAQINPTQDYDAIHTLTFASASGTCKIRLYRGSNSVYTGTVYYRAGTSGAWTSLSASGDSTTFNVTSTTMQVAHDWNKSGNNYMTPSFYGQSTNLVGISISQKAVLSGTVGDYFMRVYAYGCTSLTSLDVPDTSGLTSVGNYFMYNYAYGCSNLTSLPVPDTSGLTSVGDSFMQYYAQGCSSLTSLGVPDTSGFTSIGDYFMLSYAYSCTSLISLILPAVGWFATHNIDWGIPSGRLGYLKGYANNVTDRDNWRALTTSTSPNTLYINYIRSADNVILSSTGTEADSERGLYIAGYATSNSTRGLYLQGYLTSDSTRGLYIEGFVDTLYSRESSASLKADDSNLSTMFSEQDYTDVTTDDDTFVDLEGTAQYFQLLFKEPNGNENNTDDFRVTWKGKSTLAPSSSAVYLQIYNRTTESWITLASNSSASANVEFTLEDTASTDLSDYYDVNYIISVRVYQDGVV